MPKSKHSPEFRAKVSQEYLDDYLPWNPLVKEFCR